MISRENPLDIFNLLDGNIYADTLIDENDRNIGHRPEPPARIYRFYFESGELGRLELSAACFDTVCIMKSCEFEGVDLGRYKSRLRGSVGWERARAIDGLLIPYHMAEPHAKVKGGYVLSRTAHAGRYTAEIVQHPLTMPLLPGIAAAHSRARVIPDCINVPLRAELEILVSGKSPREFYRLLPAAIGRAEPPRKGRGGAAYAFSAEGYKDDCAIFSNFVPVNKSFSRPGDIVAYFGRDAQLAHAGIYEGDGTIRSKWGENGPVLRHLVEMVPLSYGVTYSFLRNKQ